MSSIGRLPLPRFHVKPLAQTIKDQRSPAMALPEEAPFAPEQDCNPEAASPEGDSPAPADALAPPAFQPEIDTGAILNALEAAVAGLQADASAQTNQVLSEFIQAAFPRLAEAFLAEEILRELADMSPPEVARLTLKVPAHFEPAFQTAIQASPRMQDICELQSRDREGELVVEVGWQDGGLQFDLERFVQSCLARLARPEPT